MEEASGNKQAPPWAAVAGIAAALFLLLRIRKRRQKKKLQKMIKAREKARQGERRRKEAGAVKKEKPSRKEKKKQRSLPQQLLRFAVFQLAKKIISKQIDQMEIDLSKGKLGGKILSAAETPPA